MEHDKRVLITGGAGNIGSHIVDYLIKDGYRDIIVVDDFSRGRRENLRNAEKSGFFQIVEGDIRDYSFIESQIAGASYVFHEASTRITQCIQNPRVGHEVIVNGSYNVFEACAKNNVEKLVFASSASVYGEPSYLPMDEKHPFNNKTLYGVGKIFSEELAKSFRDMFGLNYIGLRYFNVYGPKMDVHGVYTEVMIKWLDKISKGIPPIIHGDGKQSMDFVYVGDVARANILAMKSEANEGIYNVGTGVETNLNDLCSMILSHAKSNLKPEYIVPKNFPIVSRRQACISKAERELGFKAEVSLEDGLEKLFEWIRGEQLNLI